MATVRKPPSRYPKSHVPGSKRGWGPGPSSKKAVIPGPRIQKSRKRGPVPGPSPSYSSKRVLGPGPSSKRAIIPGPMTQKGSGPRSQDALGYLEGGLYYIDLPLPAQTKRLIKGFKMQRVPDTKFLIKILLYSSMI